MTRLILTYNFKLPIPVTQNLLKVWQIYFDQNLIQRKKYFNRSILVWILFWKITVGYQHCGYNNARCNCAIVFTYDYDNPRSAYIDFCSENIIESGALNFGWDENLYPFKERCDKAARLDSYEQAFDDKFWTTNRSKYEIDFIDCAKLRSTYFVSSFQISFLFLDLFLILVETIHFLFLVSYQKSVWQKVWHFSVSGNVWNVHFCCVRVSFDQEYEQLSDDQHGRFVRSLVWRTSSKVWSLLQAKRLEYKCWIWHVCEQCWRGTVKL